MDTSNDLDVFFADFAGPVTTGKGDPFPGIFDAAYAGVLENPAVDSAAPALTIKTMDATRFGIVNGTTLSVADVNGVKIGSFKVRSNQPDGTGMSVLLLEDV